MLKRLSLPVLTLLSLLPTLPASAASRSPAAKAIKPFEGTATIQITHERVGTHVLNYSVKASRLRTELQVSEAARASAIVDLLNDEVLVLLPGQPLYVAMSLGNSAEIALGHDLEGVAIEQTLSRKKILGYTCTKYLVRHKADAFEVWATDQLGSFMGLGTALPQEAKFNPTWLAVLVGKGFFPLRVQSLPDSQNTLTMETLAVTPAPVADALFAPPPSYRRFQMGGLVEGLLGKH